MSEQLNIQVSAIGTTEYTGKDTFLAHTGHFICKINVC